MELIPAIDIRDGRCVRLLKGDFDRETRYDVDPVALARAYRELGAEWLHIVDLDGAATGRPANGHLIEQIVGASDLKIQIGGGIRSDADLDAVLEYADRVVIGSLCVTEPERVKNWLASRGGERIVLGLDVRLELDGEARVTTHGWTRASTLTLADAISAFLPAGLMHVLCTDVARDGALSGPNVELYSTSIRRWPELAFQASGGIRDANDLRQLEAAGVDYAISGKALLENRIAAKEMQSFLPNA
jgi:phosphoribosylformimino-5-aminoimidazole carboxamide ribotide isomerase